MSKDNKKIIVLLDTHAILHRSYHALPDFSSPSGEPTGALYGLANMVLKITDDFAPYSIVACFDLPEATHRHEVYEAYKAGRQKTDDELIAQLSRARDLLEMLHIPIYERAGFEADDLLGTLAEQLKEGGGARVIIASGDMDTMQLVSGTNVQVFTLKKGIQDTVLYDENAVKERFGFAPKYLVDYKGLRGDPSDNIPGIKGIGEKSASELIQKFGSIDDIYKKLNKDEEAFIAAGIKKRVVGLLKDGEDEARFSKELATIRRDVPVTFEIPEVAWSQKLTRDDVVRMCTTFGFKSLLARFEKKFSFEVNTKSDESVSEDEIEKTGLALWLVNSDITNPTYDDILAHAREHGGVANFESATELIFSELSRDELTNLYEDIELPLRVVLREMERDGVEIDVPYLQEMGEKMQKEVSKIEEKIFEMAGETFNVNSPKQLGVVLFEKLNLGSKKKKRTATGQLSTKESELLKLKDEHEIIGLILRHRELQKLLGTYVDPIPKMVDSENRLHTHYMQAGTTTGRIASRDPNIQNIPMRTEEGKAIRNAFIAKEGNVLVAADYSQIELRLAAILSGDRNLIEVFKSGADIHQAVAARVFGVEKDEVTYDMRRRAKVINFGILYGMGANALRDNLGGETTREDASKYIDDYFRAFPSLYEYLEETKAFARTHGYTKTYYGRRRYFSGIRSSIPYVRAQAERMAINAPIQGTEADIVRIAMVKIYDYLKKAAPGKARMILQVHDELVFEIEKTIVDDILPDLISIMMNIIPEKERNGVPITVEYAIGKNWGSLK